MHYTSYLCDTLRKKDMDVIENQTYEKRTAKLMSKAEPLKKTKNTISNSFFKRIISLLKREEVI